MSLLDSVPRKLILASASPRRQELLTTLGVKFSVCPADINEALRPGESPYVYVTRMAMEKASVVQRSTVAETSVVLGADTVVVVAGRILGKPHDRAEALAMLSLLSARTHQVFSGVAMTDGSHERSCLSVTAVTFRTVHPSEQQYYWETGEPRDKAGGYAIQGLGAVFVRQLVGSYSGVVGLPLYETAEMLQDFGFDVISRAP